MQYLVKQFKIMESKQIYSLLLMKEQETLVSSVRFVGSKYISDHV